MLDKRSEPDTPQTPSAERLRRALSRPSPWSARWWSYLAFSAILLLGLLIPALPASWEWWMSLREVSAQPNPPAESASRVTASAALDPRLGKLAHRLMQAWDPGPLAQAHQSLARDCRACHQAPFVQVRDEACRQCHQSVGEHLPRHRLSSERGERFAQTRCAECHRDHKGAALAVRAQDACVNCHQDVKAWAPGAQSLDVTDFSAGHPEFRLTLQDAGSHPQVRRVRQGQPADAGFVDRPGLKFNHALHLDPNGVRDPGGRLQPAGGQATSVRRTRLECSDCHRPLEGGARMASISMERHCQRCHSLAFEPGASGRQLAHGKDAPAGAMLQEFYARLALGEVPPGVRPPPDLPRERPGAVLAYEDRQRVLELADRKATQVMREFFDTRKVCTTCHEIKAGGGAQPSQVQPVRASHAWMPAARFDHARHLLTDCQACHDVARSRASSDIAMAGIGVCRECHTGQVPQRGWVRSDCSTCHGFHGLERSAVSRLTSTALIMTPGGGTRLTTTPKVQAAAPALGASR